MSTVDIADIDAALGKVRAFLMDIDQNYLAWQNSSAYDRPTPQQKFTDGKIQEQLPLITRIAARADAELAAKMQKDDNNLWPYYGIRDAAQQLAGLLSTIDEMQQILGPVGPKLAAASLHPWIWNAAVNLWDDGHRREAVQAAATALFDQHLPAKLGVPGPPSAKDRISQAFATDPPQQGKPRLRLDDYPDPSPNWTSQHEGAKFFGMGCAQLIRNLATHTGKQPDEQSALEELAALSALARLVDRAKVVH